MALGVPRCLQGGVLCHVHAKQSIVLRRQKKIQNALGPTTPPEHSGGNYQMACHLLYRRRSVKQCQKGPVTHVEICPHLRRVGERIVQRASHVLKPLHSVRDADIIKTHAKNQAKEITHKLSSGVCSRIVSNRERACALTHTIAVTINPQRNVHHFSTRMPSPRNICQFQGF